MDIYKIGSYVLAFVLANLGIFGLKIEHWLEGISLIILGFMLVYFSSYVSQINKNEEEIAEIKQEIEKIKETNEIDRKLLNTLKDIRLLERK